MQKWYHVYIHLADAEWGNNVMRAVANEYFQAHSDIADRLVVCVYEHGGWFLDFVQDGTTVGTANDTAVFGGKSVELRANMKDAEWVHLPSIRRQHLVDEGVISPIILGRMLRDQGPLKAGQDVRLTPVGNDKDRFLAEGTVLTRGVDFFTI